VGPARCQDDVARRGQPLEASIAVDLQYTTEVLEMSGRMFCLAIRTVEVDGGSADTRAIYEVFLNKLRRGCWVKSFTEFALHDAFFVSKNRFYASIKSELLFLQNDVSRFALWWIWNGKRPSLS
jgi:hypothetical protein